MDREVKCCNFLQFQTFTLLQILTISVTTESFCAYMEWGTPGKTKVDV